MTKHKRLPCSLPNCPALRIGRQRWCAIHDAMAPAERLDEWSRAFIDGDIPKSQPPDQRICFERTR